MLWFFLLKLCIPFILLGSICWISFSEVGILEALHRGLLNLLVVLFGSSLISSCWVTDLVGPFLPVAWIYRLIWCLCNCLCLACLDFVSMLTLLKSVMNFVVWCCVSLFVVFLYRLMMYEFFRWAVRSLFGVNRFRDVQIRQSDAIFCHFFMRFGSTLVILFFWLLAKVLFSACRNLAVSFSGFCFDLACAVAHVFYAPLARFGVWLHLHLPSDAIDVSLLTEWWAGVHTFCSCCFSCFWISFCFPTSVIHFYVS